MKRGTNKWLFAIVVLTGVTVFAGAVLSVPRVVAESNSSTDSVSVNIPVACTMIGTLTKPHTASVIGGTETQLDANGMGIGTTTVNTICNDKNGYLVYVKGVTQNENSEVVLSASVGSDYDIKTGTGRAASSNNTPSWGMKLAQVTGGTEQPPIIVSDENNDFTDFTGVPNVWTKVAYKESGTSSVVNSQFTTTYSVYTTVNQPAGTYSGQVQYVMLHPSTTTVTPTTTLENAFAAAQKTKVTVTDPVTKQTGSFYKMQDMENAICNAATYTDDQNSIQLVDARDNKLYWVTKLQDGHCWMTQNLDLDLSPSTVLTSNDTDLNDTSVAGAYMAGYSYDTNTRVISWQPTNTTRNYVKSTGTAWKNDYNVAYSLDPGEWYWDGNDSTTNCSGYFTADACKDHFTTFADSDPASARDSVNKHLSVGNYYNWSAAIASNGSGSLSSSTYNDINLNPQNSICPKGWRLPTITNNTGNNAYSQPNSKSEFGRLNYVYNGGGSTDAKLISAPLWFVRSGYISNGSFNNAGSEASYWSSTVRSSIDAYYLYFAQSSVNPASDYGYRYYGRSVRCVAR